MKYLSVLAVLVVIFTGIAGFGNERTSPLATDRDEIDWYPYIVQFRQYFNIDLVDTVVNPINYDSIRTIWLFSNIQRQYLDNLHIYIQRFGAISTLRDLTQVSGFRSPRAILRVLMFWQFPDELAFAEDDFFKEEKPFWWDAVGPLK